MISPGRRLSDPLQVRLAARGDRNDDEFGELVVVKFVEACLQRWNAIRGRLHDDLTLALGFDLPLPPVDRFHLAHHVDAGGQSLFHQNGCQFVAVGAASDRRPHHDAVDFHPNPLFLCCTKAENAVLNVSAIWQADKP